VEQRQLKERSNPKPGKTVTNNQTHRKVTFADCGTTEVRSMFRLISDITCH